MAWRMIKDSVKYSKTINDLSWFEEVCFYRLLVTADDYGRFYRDSTILKSELFPRKGDLTVKSIDEAFETLERVSLIKSYWASGERYLQIVTWDKHQRIRAAKSKFPEPDGEQPTDGSTQATDAGLLSDICRTDVGQMHKNKNTTKNKKTMTNSAPAREASPPPFLPDGEAEQIAGDHNAIFDRMKYCGFVLNSKIMDDAVQLYTEYGLETMLNAIDECAGASGDKMRYLRKVLKNAGMPRPGEREEEFNFVYG
ncbi:MAG: hypothetical protein IJ188_03050 [Clostridia bacterium]|nr:hypothetical protein [Clostridia bacterium]